jgi:hypothetical protein
MVARKRNAMYTDVSEKLAAIFGAEETANEETRKKRVPSKRRCSYIEI